MSFAFVTRPLSEDLEMTLPAPEILEAGNHRVRITDGEERYILINTKAGAEEKISFRVVVEVFGNGKCYVSCTADVFGRAARVDIAIQATAHDSASVFVDQRAIARASETNVFLCTNIVLKDSATSRARMLVSVGASARGAEVREKLQQLMLSPLVRAMNVPELDIACADTVSSHVASLVPPDAHTLCYLRLRGLSEYDAREAIAQAFSVL